jgi:hypothetical protein
MSLELSLSARRREPSGGELPIGCLRPATVAPERRQPVERARYALAEWLSHLIAVAGLLLGLHGVEALMHSLGSPLISPLEAGAAGLIIGFLGFAVYSVLNTYGAEPEAEAEDVAGTGRFGRIARVIRLALRPAPASFTVGVFAERLAGQFLAYAVILAASIHLWLFTVAPWPVAIASLGLLLLFGIMSVAVSAPRGSLWGKVKWLVEIRMAIGSFVAVFALLLLVEELLRRSS